MRLPYFDPIGPFEKSTPFERGDWFAPTAGLDRSVRIEKQATGWRVLKIAAIVLATAALLALSVMVIADMLASPSSPSPFPNKTFF